MTHMLVSMTKSTTTMAALILASSNVSTSAVTVSLTRQESASERKPSTESKKRRSRRRGSRVAPGRSGNIQEKLFSKENTNKIFYKKRAENIETNLTMHCMLSDWTRATDKNMNGTLAKTADRPVALKPSGSAGKWQNRLEDQEYGNFFGMTMKVSNYTEKDGEQYKITRDRVPLTFFYANQQKLPVIKKEMTEREKQRVWHDSRAGGAEYDITIAKDARVRHIQNMLKWGEDQDELKWQVDGEPKFGKLTDARKKVLEHEMSLLKPLDNKDLTSQQQEERLRLLKKIPYQYYSHRLRYVNLAGVEYLMKNKDVLHDIVQSATNGQKLGEVKKELWYMGNGVLDNERKTISALIRRKEMLENIELSKVLYLNELEYHMETARGQNHFRPRVWRKTNETKHKTVFEAQKHERHVAYLGWLTHKLARLLRVKMGMRQDNPQLPRRTTLEGLLVRLIDGHSEVMQGYDKFKALKEDNKKLKDSLEASEGTTGASGNLSFMWKLILGLVFFFALVGMAGTCFLVYVALYGNPKSASEFDGAEILSALTKMQQQMEDAQPLLGAQQVHKPTMPQGTVVAHEEPEAEGGREWSKSNISEYVPAAMLMSAKNKKKQEDRQSASSSVSAQDVTQKPSVSRNRGRTVQGKKGPAKSRKNSSGSSSGRSRSNVRRMSSMSVRSDRRVSNASAVSMSGVRHHNGSKDRSSRVLSSQRSGTATNRGEERRQAYHRSSSGRSNCSVRSTASHQSVSSRYQQRFGGESSGGDRRQRNESYDRSGRRHRGDGPRSGHRGVEGRTTQEQSRRRSRSVGSSYSRSGSTRSTTRRYGESTNRPSYRLVDSRSAVPKARKVDMSNIPVPSPKK